MSEAQRIGDERRREALFAFVLLRHFARGESLPTSPAATTWAFLADTLESMQEARLLQRDGDEPFLRATEIGRGAWRRLSSSLEGIRRLDVLARVNLRVELGDDVSDDGVDVHEDASDPRFVPPSSSEEAAEWGTEDVRAAVLSYLAGGCEGVREVDAHRLALLLQLADGRLSDDAAWFDLAHGAALMELEERAENAYRYSDVSDDPGVIDDVMRHIYEAGITERRKRTGEPALCLRCQAEAVTSLWCAACEGAWLRELASPIFEPLTTLHALDAGAEGA